MIKFNPTITGIVQFIFLCLPFGVLIAYPLIFGSVIGNSILKVAILPCSISAWIGASRVFIRKLRKQGNIVYFQFGPFKYKLDNDRFRIHYEKVFVLGGNFKDYYALVLYRDIDKIVGLSFNNKFVLAYEMDEVKLAFYKKEFETKLGIEINTVDSIW